MFMGKLGKIILIEGCTPARVSVVHDVVEACNGFCSIWKSCMEGQRPQCALQQPRGWSTATHCSQVYGNQDIKIVLF